MQATLPDEWLSYLADERGLAPPEGYYLLPACEDCSQRVSVQKELDDLVDAFDEDSRARLDEVDLAGLIEEDGAPGE